ncbi:unnamed protein product, partial [Gongylonema pulchrum]|uniref:Sema domain-containing protein n=1 Tax=Gongylonema pulchrum TaxID=637853 RepID=A0A183D2C3_9BILA
VEHEVCGGSGATFSRIGRLCRSDYGGPRSYANEWTSFVKARLNCSIPGNYPFYFDQIEATAVPINGRYSSENKQFARLVYAVFRSPLAGISSSAICAFDIQQINAIISKSTFGRRNSMQTLWLDAMDIAAASKRRSG